MAKLKMNTVLKGITKGMEGILDDVASEGFENKLRKSLKDIGYSGTSSNGNKILKFAGRSADEASEGAIDKLYNIIDKNGIKNIDDLNKFTGNITKGRDNVNALAGAIGKSGMSDDPAIVKSILRKKGINPSTISSEQISEVTGAIKGNKEHVRSVGSKTPTHTPNIPKENIKGEAPRVQVKEAPSIKELKGKMYDSKDDYMRYSAAKEYEDAMSSLEKKDFNNPILKNLEKQGKDLNTLNTNQLGKLRDNAIAEATGKNMELADNMGYYQIPQKATAAAGTMWLVNKLASSNGQQSNAQLYGQQAY